MRPDFDFIPIPIDMIPFNGDEVSSPSPGVPMAIRDGFVARLLQRLPDSLVVGDFAVEPDRIRCLLVQGSVFEIGEFRDAATTMARIMGDSSSTPAGYVVRLRPGSVQDSESHRCTSEGEIRGMWDSWTACLADEVAVKPTMLRIRQAQDDIATMRRRVDALDTDVGFAADEIERLRKELDEALKRVGQEIANATGPVKDDLERAKKDIAFLKANLEGMTRKTWLTAAAARLPPLALAGVRVGVKTIVDTAIDRATKFLPDNGNPPGS